MTQTLKKFLDEASINYYSGSPTISDDVFDRLAESIGYTKVGAPVLAASKGKHYYQLFSQQKYYEDEKGKKPLEGFKTVPSLKLDGACISLLYVNGKLVQALTRGDGIVGQDITERIIGRKDLVPLNILHPGVLQVAGEIIAPKNIENSRNYAAGALNLKDTSEFNIRALSFFAHSVYPYVKDTFTKDMEYLQSLGFETVNTYGLDSLYECDGVVHRIDDNATFDAQGYTAKHPKGAYALKIRKEAVETTLLAVEWNTSKSGRVNPVAILEPVYIGDALVSRATLNNKAFIEALGLYIGCTVAVIRSGDVIPCVLCKVE